MRNWQRRVSGQESEEALAEAVTAP
jgi:hypothetical protein